MEFSYGGGGERVGSAGSSGGGGDGGNGVVILRFSTASYTGNVAGSPTVTTSGDDTIIKWTGNGTYTQAEA